MSTGYSSALMIVVSVDLSVHYDYFPLSEFLYDQVLDADTLLLSVVEAAPFILNTRPIENIVNIGLFVDKNDIEPLYELQFVSPAENYDESKTNLIPIPGRLEKLLVNNAPTQR